MSAYVLYCVLGSLDDRAAALWEKLKDEHARRFALAELNDFLTSLGAIELRGAFRTPPPASVPAETANYVAAMVELACAKHRIAPPDWTHAIAPLTTPWFGSTLAGVRLHLLAHSPPPFRRRNIFIDTSLGGRV